MFVKTSSLLTLAALVVPGTKATNLITKVIPPQCYSISGIGVEDVLPETSEPFPCTAVTQSGLFENGFELENIVIPSILYNHFGNEAIPFSYIIPAYVKSDGTTEPEQCIGGVASAHDFGDGVKGIAGTFTYPDPDSGNNPTCTSVADATDAAKEGGGATLTFNFCFNRACSDDPCYQKDGCYGNPPSCFYACGSRRRLMDDAITFQEGVPAFQDLSDKYLKKCSDFEYDASLSVVGSHLMISAKPPKEAIDAAECPFVATHSAYNHETMMHKKEVIVWENNFDHADAHLNTDSYPLGRYKLSHVAQVFEDIDLSKSMPQGKAYDLITNNCATYLLAFAKAMNFEVDTKIKAFVARRLFQSSTEDFVDRIRNSVNFQSMFNRNDRNLRAASGSASDEQVVELLVEETAAGFF